MDWHLQHHSEYKPPQNEERPTNHSDAAKVTARLQSWRLPWISDNLGVVVCNYGRRHDIGSVGQG
jgi:hypothetical protein